jgi:HlyD family secretion protein
MLRMPRGAGRPRADRPSDGTRTLYVLKDGAPAPVKVKTGSTDGDRTEIVSGLAEGDQVVIGASQAGQ